MWTQIAAHISQVTGHPFEIVQQRSVGGGCINHGAAVSDGVTTYFVKHNRAADLSMFEAELAGLQQMQATGAIRVPTPICCGKADGTAYIVLEWLELGRGQASSWASMGQHLATLHQATSDRGFGWNRHNTIGATPQLNPWTDDWTTFWQEHRIGYQLRLGQRNGGHFPQGDRLYDAIPQLLAGYTPKPSLVHGDLWSGNAAFTQAGEPVILDPATYYGDREVDIAMTELFGGFPADFYRGYNATLPLDEGCQTRKTLYNLYHILNHFNLFGGSYESQANRMISQLLAIVR